MRMWTKDAERAETLRTSDARAKDVYHQNVGTDHTIFGQ